VPVRRGLYSGEIPSPTKHFTNPITSSTCISLTQFGECSFAVLPLPARLSAAASIRHGHSVGLTPQSVARRAAAVQNTTDNSSLKATGIPLASSPIYVLSRALMYLKVCASSSVFRKCQEQDIISSAARSTCNAAVAPCFDQFDHLNDGSRSGIFQSTSRGWGSS
jgi:hypothetical protein